MRSYHDPVKRLIRLIAAGLFIAAIPVALLLTNVRVAATQPLVYEYALSRYDAVERTGIERSELDRAVREIIAYFGSGHIEDLAITVAVEGRIQPLFNLQEVLHMRDVRALFQGAFRLQEIALIYVIAYVGTIVVRDRRRAIDQLAPLVSRGGALTAGVLGLTGVAMLIGFHWLFTQFHVISFSNDYWKLNADTDRLVQMFPDGFWFDASLTVALVTLFEGLLIAVVAYVLMRRRSGFVGPSSSGAGQA